MVPDFVKVWRRIATLGLGVMVVLSPVSASAQNMAPVLDNSGNLIMKLLVEDNTSSAGDHIFEILNSAGTDAITDADPEALEGIAIIDIDDADGTVEYSLDNGQSWIPVSGVNGSTALLLPSTFETRLRFVPNPSFTGIVNTVITFHAWDLTTGLPGETADPTASQAFSDEVETVSIEVRAMATPLFLPLTITAAVDAVHSGDIAWADADNDGDLDFLLSGAVSGNPVTKLYINGGEDGGAGDWLFTASAGSFASVDSSAIAWSDFDRDGDMDVVITGRGTGTIGAAVTKLYTNNAGAFTESNAGLISLAGGDIGWLDYNHDGLQDILITGEDNAGTPVTRIYGYDGSAFTEISGTGLDNLKQSRTDIADYNGDGYTDIFLSGVNSDGDPYAALYTNGGDSTFTADNASFAQVAGGSVTFGDLNNDGFADLVLTGVNSSGDPVTKIYENQQGSFSALTATLADVTNGSTASGDIDQDGDADLFVTGSDASGNAVTKLYRNDNNVFTDATPAFASLKKSVARLADFDADGDLDIILTGDDGTTIQTVIYENATTADNAIPAPPGDLTVTVQDSTAMFFWLFAYDAETPTNALTYRAHVWKDGGEEILLPEADLTSGKPKRPGPGNISGLAKWALHDLDFGKYFWTVQSVDQGQQASVFSNTSTFTINKRPTAENNTITIQEDIPDTLAVTDFNFSDATDVLPGEFTRIRIESPPLVGELQVNGQTVTPGATVTTAFITDKLLVFVPPTNQNGSGLASFRFRVNDGTDFSSEVYTITFDVSAINDAPVFDIVDDPSPVNEDAGLQTIEDFATGIATAPIGATAESGQVAAFNVKSVVVTSGDLAFTSAPAVSTTGTLTYQPLPNTFGTAQVTLELSDNGPDTDPHQNTSDERTFTITVNSVNDAPAVTASNVQIDEDQEAQQIESWATFSPGPSNENIQQLLSYAIENVDDPGSILASGPSLSIAGTLSYSIKSNAFGAVSFDVKVTDNGSSGTPHQPTAVASFTITVKGVNDKPDFTASDPETVNENSGTQTLAGWSAFDAGNEYENQQVLQYEVSNITNAALFTTGGQPAVGVNGTLTYTPAPGSFGTSAFDVTVQDNGGTTDGGVDVSSKKTFTITVNPINDQPDFSATDPPGVSEDAGEQVIENWASFDPGSAFESTQTVESFTVTDVTNPQLFRVSPHIDHLGTLSYETATNQTGSSDFTVSVKDDGGTENGGTDQSGEKVFTITVSAVNDTPDFIASDLLPVLKNSGPITVIDWASFDPGPDDESSQALAGYTVTNVSNPSLFAALPQVNLSGDLTFESASGETGSSTFDVLARDNGGTANGGVDLSDARTFTITIFTVNAAPDFNAMSPPVVNEDAGTQQIMNWALFEPGDPDESSQEVSEYLVSDISNPSLFELVPQIDNNGTLSYRTRKNAHGASGFKVAVRDNGGIEGGGSDLSLFKTFTLTVDPVNDAPELDNEILRQTATEGVAYVLNLNENTFADVDDEILTYSASLIDGAGLPAWLTFDPASLNFSGTPGNDDVGTYSIRVTAQDPDHASASATFDLKALNVNNAPTDISLNNASIKENLPAGTLIGNLSTTDPDVGNTHTYSLVQGTGSEDNSSFRIQGNKLVSARIFDFESDDSFTVRVRTDDGMGAVFTESFTVDVIFNNTAPSDIALSKSVVNEKLEPGILVGSLSALDPDILEVHTFELVTGEDSDDNSAFSVSNKNLYTTATFEHSVKSIYAIRIRVTDRANAQFEKTFSITIVPVADPVTGIEPDPTNKVETFPNPVQEELFIEWTGAYRGSAEITIFSTQGQKVMTQQVFKQGEVFAEKISTLPLSKGLYYLRISTPQITIREKLIRE